MHSSNLHMASVVDKCSAHRLMYHSSRTAETHYMTHQLQDVAAHGHAVLTANIQLTDCVPTGVPSSPSSPEKSLTQQQCDDIDLLFADIINTNASLSLTKTYNILSDSINFVNLLQDDTIMQNVYKRVKYLQTKHLTENLRNIYEKDAKVRPLSWVGSITTSNHSERIQKQWCQEDEKTIEEEFCSCKSCPGKGVIISAFEDTASLVEIVSRNTIQRCYEKVKTIFKKKK